jgi:hypothetical protein
MVVTLSVELCGYYSVVLCDTFLLILAWTLVVLLAQTMCAYLCGSWRGTYSVALYDAVL